MKWIISSIIVGCLTGVSICGEYVVIVNKDNPLTSVSSSDLKRLYTGKTDNIGSSKIEPVNLSTTTDAAASFLTEIVGMGTVDYKSFWLAQQIRGESSAPTVKKSAEEMISYVKENANAIGYIPKGTAPDGVKVLTVK
jgi:ABC-type phosphate transport system substrate-binding protein